MGALASHAQRFLAELTTDEIRLVRGILLSLVHPDGTRRPRLRAEVLGGIPAASRTVADCLLDRLLERRLLVATRDAEQDSTTVELAHEALATAWPQLARWLDETYEERVLITDLEQASLLWQRRGRRDAETWGGLALAEAVRKVAEWNITLSSVSRAFLDMSVQRDRRIQRRQRRIATVIVVVLAIVAIGAAIAAVAFARKSEELDRAATDLGRIQLEIRPFDWDPVQQRRLVPRTHPPLEWRLFGTSPDDPQEKGHPYDDSSVRRGGRRWRDDVLIEDVEVRSGPAFIEIRGRGGDCAPSVLYLQRLPGYRERSETTRIEISVPTCEASRAGLIQIPSGPFLRAMKQNGKEIDQKATAPDYSIDRTEVTRGAFEAFESMKHLTGVRISPADYLLSDPATDRRLPISGIDYAIARSYCRYMGKDLPTADQWQKAFRGGLGEISGKSNLSPARSTPWDGPTAPGLANLAPGDDGKGRLAAVGEHPRDVSPYGVLDLGGNVREWLRDPSETMKGMRRVAGGSWESPPKKGHERIYFINVHSEEYRDHALGARCVSVTSLMEKN